MVITPVNYSLMAVNMCMSLTAGIQVGRIAREYRTF